MHFIAVIVIGFIVGLLARFLMPGRDRGGFILTTLLGIVGAILGTFLGQTLGFYAPGEPAGFLMSIVGALVILFLGRRLGAASE